MAVTATVWEITSKTSTDILSGHNVICTNIKHQEIYPDILFVIFCCNVITINVYIMTYTIATR